MKFLFIILFLFFSLKLYASDHIDNYVCELLLNENTQKSPLKSSAPQIMQISYEVDSNKLVDFSWDGKSLINDFVAVEFSSSSKILEIWRKGYKFSDEDNVLFELYASDLVGHLYKMHIDGLDYQCSKY